MPLTVETYDNGKDGGLWIGPIAGTLVELPASAWEGTFAADKDETSNFMSAGWKERSYGLQEGSGTITVEARTDKEIYAATIGIKQGAFVQAQMFSSKTRGRAYYGVIGIDSVKDGATTKGAVRYEIAWSSHGVMQQPDGTIVAVGGTAPTSPPAGTGGGGS